MYLQNSDYDVLSSTSVPYRTQGVYGRRYVADGLADKCEPYSHGYKTYWRWNGTYVDLFDIYFRLTDCELSYTQSGICHSKEHVLH